MKIVKKWKMNHISRPLAMLGDGSYIFCHEDDFEYHGPGFTIGYLLKRNPGLRRTLLDIQDGNYEPFWIIAGVEAPAAIMATQINWALPAKTITDIIATAHHGRPAFCASTPRARPMGK